MQTKSEFYKGIEFIRIANLPADQKEIFLKNFSQDKVIKILKDDLLIPDCILYSDYDAWFQAQYPTSIIKSGAKPLTQVRDLSLIKN
jgi:hypothetical protein